MKYLLTICLLWMTVVNVIADYDSKQEVDPSQLEFHRLSVRRFIFSNNINLNEFVPSEIVAFGSMHPAFQISDNNKPQPDDSFHAQIEKGVLTLNQECGNQDASIYIGGVNPYATYEIDIDSISPEKETDATIIGMELARLGLRDRIQIYASVSQQESGIFLRIYKDTKLVRETSFSNTIPQGKFSLKAQLYGHTLAVFITQYGETHLLGYVRPQDHFGDILDFRKQKDAKESTFNLISNLKGQTQISGARSYLSPGMGQADIRVVSYEDLTPYIENGRIWFTFSCRGLDTSQSAQGIFSLNPSVFDLQFEGMIVFDHGDSLLRNDYASHLFFDRQAKEWRAWVSDFGGSANLDRRSETGLVTATSKTDPRRGFSVMKATRVTTEQLDGHNEDPCIFYDKEDNKWKLLTSAFVNNDITSRTYESDTWNGVFKPVASPIDINSTGTTIQRFGNKYYALMGGHGNLRVHSFPDLKQLGELNLSLQPHWPKPAGRIWASVVPLPEGYPYRYILLTMDRANFPNVQDRNWSYGALYFYGAELPVSNTSRQ